MDRRFLLLSLVAGGVAACAPRVYAPPSAPGLMSLRPLADEVGEISEPLVGDRSVTAVGAPMFIARSVRWRSLVYISGVPEIEWFEVADFRSVLKPAVGWFYETHSGGSGATYLEEIRMSVQRFYKGKPYDDYPIWGMYRLEAGSKVSLVLRNEDEADLTVKPLGTLPLQRKRELAPADDKPFRRELVYTGRSGKTISILYREFSGDLARPAFTQQLQYDIEQDAVIGYQGARFRVLSATNTELTYEVLSPMSAR